MIRAFLVEHPVEIELHGVGSEGRAIVELDAVAQGEGVGEAVRADPPTLGEGRFDLQCAVLVADQTVVQVHENAEVVDGGDRSRIERLRLRDLSDDKNIGRRLRESRAAAGGRRGQEKRRRDFAYRSFHRCSP